MKKHDASKAIALLICGINDSRADTAIFKNYSVEDLRELAVHLYFNGGKYPHDTANTLLHNILTVRCRLMNQKFR